MITTGASGTARAAGSSPSGKTRMTLRAAPPTGEKLGQRHHIMPTVGPLDSYSNLTAR
jgi:hypothetical protein